MGRLVKRHSRINRKRGLRGGGGEFADKAFRRSDGAIVKVCNRVGTRNRSVYSAVVNGTKTTITAKAIRKLAPAF